MQQQCDRGQKPWGPLVEHQHPHTLDQLRRHSGWTSVQEGSRGHNIASVLRLCETRTNRWNDLLTCTLDKLASHSSRVYPTLSNARLIFNYGRATSYDHEASIFFYYLFITICIIICIIISICINILIIKYIKYVFQVTKFLYLFRII